MSKDIYQCNQCDKSFKSKLSRAAHMKSHSNKKAVYKKSLCLTCDNLITNQHFKNHLDKRKKCLNCNKLFCIKGGESKKKFCSKSCSASYNNTGRIRTEKYKTQLSLSMKNYCVNNKKYKPVLEVFKNCKNKIFQRDFVVGSYTKIFKNYCNHCNDIFYKRTKNKFCDEHIHLYTEKNRKRLSFKI